MIREEFYKKYPEFNHIGSPTSIFEKIIVNDFKSKICENCKYSRGVRSSRYNSRIDAKHCTVLNQKVEDNFGCVKFEGKDKWLKNIEVYQLKTEPNQTN